MSVLPMTSENVPPLTITVCSNGITPNAVYKSRIISVLSIDTSISPPSLPVCAVSQIGSIKPRIHALPVITKNRYHVPRFQKGTLPWFLRTAFRFFSTPTFYYAAADVLPYVTSWLEEPHLAATADLLTKNCCSVLRASCCSLAA